MKQALTTSLIVLAVAACCLGAGESARPRIVTLSPALTRIAFEMGLGDHVVGVARFSKLPPHIERPEVGDAFNISTQRILEVSPDVVVHQTSSSKFSLPAGVKVVAIPIETIDDIARAVEQMGIVAHKSELGAQQAAAFRVKIDYVRKLVAGRKRPRVLYVSGTTAPDTVGAGTFIGDMIEAAGGINVGAEITSRPWGKTHLDAIVAAAPDVLLCHNYDAGSKQKTLEYWLGWKDMPAARQGRVHFVGDEWSIPSTAVSATTLKLASMLHPDAFVAPPATQDAISVPWASLARARLFRILAAAVVGAALAAAGAALQGLLRNPLAEPYILGISSGAGVGVLLGLAVAAWYSMPQWLTTPVLAMAGGLATCAIVYLIAQRRGRLDPYSLILSGVIVNVFNAAIMLTIYLYVDPDRIADFAHWSMGRIEDSIDPSVLAVCGGCLLAGWLVLIWKGSAYDLLGLGDDVASSSGVRVGRLRIVTFACVGLMTAAAVALAGPIGFLGLVVPHICRMLLGPSHRRLIFVSGLGGAVVLIAAEMLCRTAGPLIGVSLIPVGIVTALTGGPFFIILLRRRFSQAT